MTNEGVSLDLIHQASQTFADLWNQGQLEEACGVYAENAVLITRSKGLVTGRGNIIDIYRGSYPSRAEMGILTFTIVDVRFTPDSATVSAVIEWEIVGGPKIFRGYSLEVYVLAGGRLSIVQGCSIESA